MEVDEDIGILIEEEVVERPDIHEVALVGRVGRVGKRFASPKIHSLIYARPTHIIVMIVTLTIAICLSAQNEGTYAICVCIYIYICKYVYHRRPRN